MSQISFSTLKLKPGLLSNLSTLGYETMTPIQAQSLPYILSGKDVIAQGKTGSGKTAAFGLGLLENLNVKRFRIQTLVLCPTRELADQVATEIRRLARGIHNIKVLTLCGGVPFGPQVGSLEHGAHIVVGTPGRVDEHLRKGTLRLDDLNTFVLDEADRMLEMGFQEAVEDIVGLMPEQRQTLLFSATFSEEIKTIAQRIMLKPIIVKVEFKHDDLSIQQHFYKVDDNDQRLTAVRLLLLQHRPESTVIFCNTKKDAQEVADELHHFGFSVMALHGDLDQKDRDQTLVRFANKSVSILVATDVAARGLDIDALDAVINYHIARDPEIHLHRIGRTGRAGSKGIACSLISDKESHKVIALGNYLDMAIEGESLPAINFLDKPIFAPQMATLQIEGGKKQKMRPGDILGALTGDSGVAGKQVGKINVFDNWAYVAVQQEVTQVALKKLGQGKLKGRSFRVRLIRA
ncbi:ATP-dependent RNA helicase DbpA [methanotrophic endosymbiont of Bathymodiolus puteoserpentis (Logatchev)]|uniref:ATP-dependent RNA helicase DbpA n=1 Tax=methanotrophic endosymbiont of Bathymodiolus puteoserpentis (Logatchev) TaxID=343235 RepID=UPI0013C6785F|nr:ATP-dependent RNA helicase DbpA [methanotrophic endosymbiont of Bathymodiolus puteoserpentis (Logatchev)]SHE19127.1 ATP-dependent 23S rRNA helicase DbpA [methanotrophic endosymbiont of Bathymodiolus puteoserpentis (Logatchev)]